MLSIIVNYARYVIIALKLGKFLEDYRVHFQVLEFCAQSYVVVALNLERFLKCWDTFSDTGDIQNFVLNPM